MGLRNERRSNLSDLGDSASGCVGYSKGEESDITLLFLLVIITSSLSKGFFVQAIHVTVCCERDTAVPLTVLTNQQ